MQLIMSAGWFAARAPCANPGSMHAMHEGSMHAIGRTSDWLQAWWRGGASPIRCIHTTEPRENSFAEFIISTASNLVQVGPTVHGCMDGRGCMVWGPALLASSSFPLVETRAGLHQRRPGKGKKASFAKCSLIHTAHVNSQHVQSLGSTRRGTQAHTATRTSRTQAGKLLLGQ